MTILNGGARNCKAFWFAFGILGPHEENWLPIRKADLFLRNTLLSAGSRGAGNSHGFLLASRETLMELSAYHLVTLCNFVIIFALVSQWFFLTGFSLALVNFTLPLLMVSNTSFFSVGKGLVWGRELYLEAGIFPLGLTRLGKQEIRRIQPDSCHVFKIREKCPGKKLSSHFSWNTFVSGLFQAFSTGASEDLFSPHIIQIGFWMDTTRSHSVREMGGF